ncbi:MAG TPA: aminotransferase class I/II-fold pyridoxal phosphate-dependent enzyme [Candidatus Limivicinus faecipullorum]|nr:aminotransferase class I/II-fold pyridoxal phosphate-dependent enzyme [Candidatus Limivicinus faecipullorum]
MKYDFTTVLDRRGRDSTAADVIPFKGLSVGEGFSTIPMWIADMSFKAAPAVMDAIYRRMEMPNFGYFPLPKEYFDSIIRWQQRRNSVEGLLPEHIGYENGVLGGVSSALQAFTAPGEEVLVHSPTYVGFTHTFQDTGRIAVHSPLKRDEEGIWRMDYEDMDRKIKEHNIHLAIFCSPHNPCGRVWERREIERAMEVYAANNCLVISDEIWSDIIMPGYKHIPTQSISEDARERTVAFYAPSKTFSLAGLVGSYHIIYNKYLRERVLRQSRLSHYNDPNVLSVHALIGGFSPEGEAWAEEMIQVVNGNLDYACGFIRDNFPGVKVMRPQGTYMLFLDCGDFCRSQGISISRLQERGVRRGVIWQNGEDFMFPDSIRMNFALPRSLAEEAMERLKKYVFV